MDKRWLTTSNNSEEEQAQNAVSRSHVFVLLDGTFVVHWQPNRVQELQTGRYRPYEKRDYGAPITDYELNQLMATGIVEAYDDEQVTLCMLPEHFEVQYLTIWEQNRVRSFYLHTTLPRDKFDEVDAELDALGVSDDYLPRVRDSFVVLWRSKGLAFQSFDEAEKARTLLASRAPQMFGQTIVAFVETSMHA